MKTLAFSSLLLLSGLTAFGQDSTELFDKAPPAIDEALRARVSKFYDAFVAGKFKDAYLLVANDSQDAFFELSKDQYKSFEIIKIRYSENFTKAAVVTAIKSDWRWHGVVTPTTFPLTSNWKVEDGEWNWHYVKPTMAATPFSPTGFVPIPPETPAANASAIPSHTIGTAQGILSKVGVDKRTVRLRSYETSQDVVHVRNDMPGQVTLNLDKLDMPGLKITVAKAQLQAHEETTILFEWRLDDPAILCADCAKKMSGNPTVQLRIAPTAQVFPINILFENAPQSDHLSPPHITQPANMPPQK
jgi:hypothetical protein